MYSFLMSVSQYQFFFATVAELFFVNSIQRLSLFSAGVTITIGLFWIPLLACLHILSFLNTSFLSSALLPAQIPQFIYNI